MPRYIKYKVVPMTDTPIGLLPYQPYHGQDFPRGKRWVLYGFLVDRSVDQIGVFRTQAEALRVLENMTGIQPVEDRNWSVPNVFMVELDKDASPLLAPEGPLSPQPSFKQRQPVKPLLFLPHSCTLVTRRAGSEATTSRLSARQLQRQPTRCGPARSRRTRVRMVITDTMFARRYGVTAGHGFW